jgi:plastocyanin
MQQELREQRQLILQLMEMHSALLRYLQSGGTGAPPVMPTAPGFPAGVGRDRATSAAVESHGEGHPENREDPATARAGLTGTISGSVRVKGGALGEAFVYLDGPKVIPSHAKTIEIKQDHKQFMPGLAVVQVGTRVLFPNEDKVFHNTFSRTPGNAFDLGTLKSGDTPKPVVFTTPGPVEVFCNIHSRMRADILVVPNGHWVRVRDDGTFQLAGVPLGSRHLVVWGPRLKQVSQRLEVTAAGVTAAFATEASAPPPHLNKHGGEYGSYED